VRELSRDDGQAGQDVQLTIDIGLQEFARERIGDESAGLVLMDVHSGDVLAMVSAPAFDPNVFSSGVSARDWEELLANPKTPLTNKAIAGQYSPGSTFKMTTALAALEAGAITPQTEINCPGHYDFGNVQFHCWKKTGHGMTDLQKAIKVSCDVFFYETARRVGIDRLAQMARRLGYGSPLGIDVPGERPGLIPDRAWKMSTLGQPWAQGETISCGIGQSYIAATPLQLATMAARIANGGYAVVPRLTRAIGGKPQPEPGPFAPIGVSAANLQLIVKGMTAVVNEPGGTGYENRIKDAGLEMAGKTGSAQTRRITQAERDKGLKDQKQLPWRERDNAVFVSFAPIQAPRYACAIVVEHGAHGAWVEPIARDLLVEAQKRDIAAGRVADMPKTGAPG
jgi:penicillin-binding protein 2